MRTHDVVGLAVIALVVVLPMAPAALTVPMAAAADISPTARKRGLLVRHLLEKVKLVIHVVLIVMATG